MQPSRQYNQPQTFGVYFPQSTAQQQFPPALGPPPYQGYGSPGPAFYGGQPLVPVPQRYPPPPPQMVPTQNYGGPHFIGAPSVKPFPDQQFNLQFPPQSQGAPQHQVPLLPTTPPQSQVLYPSPGHQGPPSQYAWSTSVTPPSPYYNNDSLRAIESELEPLFAGASPVQPCQVPLPPRLKLLGQYVAQGENAVIEVNNNENTSFNADLSTLGASPPSQFSSDKDIFKHKASQLGINIESPPDLEKLDIKTDITNSNEVYTNNDSFKDYSDPRENVKFEKTDRTTAGNDLVDLKTRKRPRNEEKESRSPIALPAKTVAQRNLKQKVEEDFPSLSNNVHNSATYPKNVSLNNDNKLPETSRYGIISKVLAEEVSSSNGLPEASRYSSFPDSSVDISKVLAENTVNSGVDSKQDEEVFDDSVDYIEEHEFLTYDVTSSPFSPCDTDEEHEENGCLEMRSHDEMLESPASAVTYNIVNMKSELKNEIDDIYSNNEKVLLKFKNEFEVSEIKKTEILKSGVVNDNNLEMLASAIVTGVLAKAVIEVCSHDSGDKNIKDSMKILDIESSIYGNLNTNAESVTPKPDPEIRKNEDNEKKTNCIDSEQNISESHEDISPTSDRQRLYSWPYSEDKGSEANNDMERYNEKVIEVTTPSKAHKVEIIVDQSADSGKENITADSIAKTIKTASESSKDFEKFYFKQKATQHGIEIVSPHRNLNSLNNLKETANVSSESDNESENMAKMKKGRLNSVDRNSRSQSESSDYQSIDSDSHADPAVIFKQKASKLGITFQNPNRTIELSTENSDAELESYTAKHKDLHLEDPRRSNTSTPEPSLFLNPESPEFKPGWRKRIDANNSTSTRHDAVESNSGSLNTSSSDISDNLSKIELRVDAPEFNPANFSMKIASQKLESLKTEVSHYKGAKIFHIPTPKAKIENPSIGIQASPKLNDISVNTRRVKTKDFGSETNSCESREVCVNTDFPGIVDQGDSHTLPVKPPKHFVSKNTNTDVPKRRSIAVSVNMAGSFTEKKKENESKVAKLEEEKAVMAEQIKYLQSRKIKENQQMAVSEQVKALQIEVMKHRANLHVNRIFLMQHKIQKEMTALVESLAFSNDRQAQDTIYNISEAKLNMLEATTRRINAFLEETVGKIQAGVQYPTLPDFTFFSDDPEQNRIIANEQLFDLAVGSPQEKSQQSNQPIKIDFSPTNRNLIEFTAEAKGEEVRTPEQPKRTPVSASKVKQSPAAKPNTVAAVFSPGGANKSACLFVNKVDPAEQDGFHDNDNEKVVDSQRVKLVDSDTDHTTDAGVILETDKHSGGQMDLDLDSEDEITEVSTALTDYEDLGLDDGVDDGKLGAEYGPGNGNLKDLISSKMNEVYGDISEYNTCESSANESSLAETSVLEKSKEIGVDSEETLKAAEAVIDTGEAIRKETIVCDAEKEIKNVETADEEESDKTTDANEMSDKVNEVVKREKLENVETEDKRKSDEVPENWESLELEKDEIYMSPEVQFESLLQSDKKDVNVPENPFKEELSANSDRTSADVVEKETDNVVPQTDSEGKPNVQTANESKVQPITQTSESVAASLPTSVATTIPSASSVLQASSMNDTLSSAVTILQPVGPNVMVPPPPMLMNSVNPMLYQMVVAQLVKAYPSLAVNPDMLSNVALQQASLLQHYIATGQISAANINDAFLQGAGDGAGMLGNLAQAGLPPGAVTESQAPVGPGTQMPAMTNGVVDSGNSGPNKTKDNTMKEINSVRGAINQTNASVDTSKELGATVNNDSSHKSNTNTAPKPVPYRPPGLRALVSSPSETMFQNTVTNKTSNSVSTVSQNPFSAVKNQPIKPTANVTSTFSARPNPPHPNANNSASGTGDLTKPLRRPFQQYFPVSKSSSISQSNNVVHKTSDKLSQRMDDYIASKNISQQKNVVHKPSDNASQPNEKFKTYNNASGPTNVVSKFSDISQSKDVVYDTIPNSASGSGLDDFDEPVRPPSRSERKPLPVSFSSVPEIKPVVSSHSLSMQGHKLANTNKPLGESKPPLPQQSTAAKPKHEDFLPQYAKRHAPELREKVEVPSRDFLPSFVKSISSEGNNLTENQQSFHDQMPPRFRRASAPQRQSSVEEENWDDEIDPYAEPKMMKINPKRELHMRSLSSRKPASNEIPGLWQSSATSQRKNSDADLTNPLFGRSSTPSTPSPSFEEGTSGLSDIPLPKKLRTSEGKTDKGEEEEKEQEWCEVRM